MANITIDGKSISGRSISISNNKIIVDGKDVTLELTGEEAVKVVKIEVDGDLEEVSTQSGDVVINGNCGPVKTMSGDVDVDGDVHGRVKTMSGDVKAKTINGGVETLSGDIRGK